MYLISNVRSVRFCCCFCSAYDVTIPAEGKALVKTDLAISVPEGCYGRVGKFVVFF